MDELFYYLFKRAADGVWIFGANSDCEHPAGLCRVVPNTARTKVSIIYFDNNQANQNLTDIPFGHFLDENGDPYASFAALKAGYAGFFFRVSSAVASDGFMYLPNTISSKGIRIGERTGWSYAVDIVLTATGFDGDEGVDWKNIGGSEIIEV